VNNDIKISVIIPVYNSQSFLHSTIKNLKDQSIKSKFEIIFIDDGSTDKSTEIIESYKLKNIKLIKLNSNSGPSRARNEGLKHAKGEYIFFFDADDSISNTALEKLYAKTKEKKLDLIFSDKKRIENNINQREDIYVFNENKFFSSKEINEEISQRLKNPLYLTGLLDLTGRLIRKSIIADHNILFDERLRYMEDETFMWDLLPYIENAFYIKEQLYSYFINPNTNTGVSNSLFTGFPLENFLIIRNKIKTCLEKRNFFNNDVINLSDQAYIFFVISSLISFYRSIVLGKVEKTSAIKKFNEYSEEVVRNQEIVNSIKNYSISKNESSLIPVSIKYRSSFFLKISVKLRVKALLKLRRKNQNKELKNIR